MVDVECPLGDCEYSGSLGSVEAHISGSTRGEHGGKQGREFREQLRNLAEEAAEKGAVLGVEGGGTEGSDPSEGGTADLADQAAESGSEGLPASAAMTAPAAAPLALAGGGGSSDIKWEYVAGAIVLIGAAFLVLRWSRSAGPSSSTERLEEEPEEEEVAESGPSPEDALNGGGA